MIMMMQFINATLCGVHNVIKWTKHSTNFTSHLTSTHSHFHSCILPQTKTTIVSAVNKARTTNKFCLYRAYSQYIHAEPEQWIGQNEWHRKIYIQFASLTKMHVHMVKRVDILNIHELCVRSVSACCRW